MNFLAMMKAVFAVFISLFMALSPGGFPRVPHGKDFKLVWPDEFDGSRQRVYRDYETGKHLC